MYDFFQKPIVSKLIMLFYNIFYANIVNLVSDFDSLLSFPVLLNTCISTKIY